MKSLILRRAFLLLLGSLCLGLWGPTAFETTALAADADIRLCGQLSYEKSQRYGNRSEYYVVSHPSHEDQRYEYRYELEFLSPNDLRAFRDVLGRVRSGQAARVCLTGPFDIDSKYTRFARDVVKVISLALVEERGFIYEYFNFQFTRSSN